MTWAFQFIWKHTVMRNIWMSNVIAGVPLFVWEVQEKLFWVSLCSLFRRRQWHPSPVLLPEKSHGRRSLVGCSPWGREESDTSERLHCHFSLSCTGEGNGNPLQCSCLENPRDGGAWWLPSMGSHRVGHDWSDLAVAAGCCSHVLSLGCHEYMARRGWVEFNEMALYCCKNMTWQTQHLSLWKLRRDPNLTTEWGPMSHANTFL